MPNMDIVIQTLILVYLHTFKYTYVQTHIHTLINTYNVYMFGHNCT